MTTTSASECWAVVFCVSIYGTIRRSSHWLSSTSFLRVKSHFFKINVASTIEFPLVLAIWIQHFSDASATFRISVSKFNLPLLCEVVVALYGKHLVVEGWVGDRWYADHCLPLSDLPTSPKFRIPNRRINEKRFKSFPAMDVLFDINATLSRGWENRIECWLSA